MKQYKICVYAICKNETKFVDKWVDSMKEADEIYVLDTGSTDDTVEKLEKRGVHVTVEKIDPWRFDVARNKSLDLVPEDTDICVCTDLDEQFTKGWRDIVEKVWKPNTTRLRYNYNWSFDEYGKPAVNFYIEKMHTRKGYKWTHPVHEVLTYQKEEPEVFETTDEVTVNHYPDQTKSRGSYLPLLELSVKENPTDDRNMHYLGREYMYYQQWNDCIDTLIKHLQLPNATWPDERCASMRFIARSYQALNRKDEAKMWLEKAIQEAPYLRDPFVEYGLLELALQNYDHAIELFEKALKIEKNRKSYINEPFCYDGTVEDSLSLAYYYSGHKQKSLEYAKKALEVRPDDERIQNNVKIIEDSIEKENSGN